MSSGADFDGQFAAIQLHERAGEWPAAERAYRELFDAARVRRRVAEMVRALLGVSYVQQRQSHWAAAEESAELGREMAARSGLTSGEARAINLLATGQYLQQRWSEAEELYRTALRLAYEVGDDQLIGSTCQNLGVIANSTGRLSQARAYYLEAIGSTVRSGDRLTAAMAYNNLGMLCADQREWLEAQVYFDRGIEIAEQLQDASVLGSLYCNRAEPLMHVGDFGPALESLERAEAICAPIGKQRTLSNVARFHGVLALLQGDVVGADSHLRRALSLAREAGQDEELAEALGELARLRWSQAHNAEAIELLAEAAQRFHILGEQREAERAEERLAHWRAEADAGAPPDPAG